MPASTLPFRLAVACESGGFRCVFVHGALATLEDAGVGAVAYSAASASVLPAAFAAIGSARSPGLQYWREALEVRRREGNGMSEMVLAGIERYAPQVEPRLFSPEAARLLVSASEIVDEESAARAQGPQATRIGREQLLAMARSDDAWARSALRPVMFDTHAGDPATRLDASRFRDVAYASSRMMHAWTIPAWVDGRPYIDASYTVGLPTRELVATGAERIVAIATGADGAWRNLYRTEPVGADADGIAVDVIAPEVDLKEMEVDFTTATEEGLARAYEHGRATATRWLEERRW